MDPLRSRLIRLAHQNPELRKELLPLLKKGGIPVSNGNIREAYYKMSDGFYKLQSAVREEPAMTDDRKIHRAMLALRFAFNDLTVEMKRFNWD